jgi:2-iminoacetate synthase
MDLAKPGAIKQHCEPNALATFQEYLDDYASPATRASGETCIKQRLSEMGPALRSRAADMLTRVRAGERDVYC